MTTDGPRRIAVTLEPAHAAPISPLLMAAYGLTDREQEIARQVLSGTTTAEIDDTLHISPTPSSNISRRSSRKLAFAAASSSSRRCSSPTTNRDFGPTNSAQSMVTGTRRPSRNESPDRVEREF